MKISLRFRNIYFVLFMLFIPTTFQLQTIDLIRDTKTIGAVLKNKSTFYLLRKNLVEVSISNSNAKEKPITLLDSDGMRPNTMTIGIGDTIKVFMRNAQYFMYKKLSSNTNITYKTVSFNLNNYQLIYIGDNRLLDTEVSQTSIIIYLIDYEANVIANHELSNSKPLLHFSLKLRSQPRILLFTQSADNKIDCNIFDSALVYKTTRTSTAVISIQWMKVFELEDNVFTVCNIINKALQCIGGVYVPDNNTITWTKLINVISLCTTDFWYHVLPIEASGQALSLCYDPKEGDLIIQKFNSNRLKGSNIRLDYWSSERVYEILSLSNSSFIVSFFGYYKYFSDQRVYYETIFYPACKDYTLDVNQNQNFPIYKSGIFSSTSEKVTITILPQEGNIVFFDSASIQLENVYLVNTIFFKKGVSGTYYFRYEIVSTDESQYTSPCLVTVNVLCYSACKTCNEIGDATRNDCLSCSSGGLMPYSTSAMIGNCKSACDDGYYSDTDFFCWKCSDKCLTCKGASTEERNNCLTCPSDKYSFKINDAYNCVSACPQYYFADGNRNCVKCFDSCAECKEAGTTNSHNCSVCPIGNYVLPLDLPVTKYNCYDGYCPDSYFVVGNTCTKCFQTCGRCSLNGDVNEQNCESCPDNSFFLPKESNSALGNCMTQCPTDCFAQGRNCVRCHADCVTCREKGNDVNSKCLTCLNNKKVLLSKQTTDSGSCVSDCPDNSFDFGTNKCVKCFPFCKSCDRDGSFTENNCLSCIEGLIELPLTTPSMYNCVHVCPDGYYTDDDIKCYNCFNTCLKCLQGPSSTSNNCIACIDGYIFHPVISTNCVPNCKGSELNWIFNSLGEYECTPTSECPTSHPILEPKYAQCVKSCTTGLECVQCKNEVLYQHKNQCVKACPEFYQNDANNICIRIPIEGLSPPQSSNNGTIIYENNNSKEDFIGDLGNMVEKSLDDILKSDKENPVIIAKNDDYEYVFSKAGSDISKESNGATIDLGQCEPILREKYSIPPNEDLYIGQVIFPQPGKNKDALQYAVYDSKGNQLNLDVCNGVTLNINQPLNIALELLLEAKRIMKEHDIDAFDPESEFFKDVCFNYTDSNQKDYTLDGRREKFIDEEAFCTKDCTYSGVNFNTNSVMCNCKPSPKKITPIIDESQLLNNILSSLPLSNLEVFKCFTLFKELNIADNYGFIILLAFQVVEVAFFVTFLLIQMPVMYSKCSFIHLNPPIRSIRSGSNLSSKPLTNQKALTVLNQNNPILDTDKKPQTNSIIFQDHYKKEKYLAQKGVMVNKDNDNETCSTEEMNEMEYKEALEKDKRHFCKYYWCIIKEKDIVLAAFASDDPFNPFMQRIFIAFYILAAYFFVSALFYTDAFVAVPNYFDFMFLLDNEIEKCFFASLVIKVLSKIIYTMLSLGKQLRKAYKAQESEVKYQREVAHLIKGNKLKTMILFGLMVITNLVMVYYVTIFCRLYPNNQIIWIVSTIISMAFNMILSALLCLVMACTRFFAFHYKKEWIYKISGYIGELM